MKNMLKKLEMIKGMSQAMIQNGLPASAAMEIFESDNFPTIAVPTNVKAERTDVIDP